jgi:CRISPR/Cas system Type II protein with McrA/HNH and RuvC-like nuclease domain
MRVMRVAACGNGHRRFDVDPVLGCRKSPQNAAVPRRLDRTLRLALARRAAELRARLEQATPGERAKLIAEIERQVLVLERHAGPEDEPES